MGKRNKRLTKKKYAVKFAAIRRGREKSQEKQEVLPPEIPPNALKQLKPKVPEELVQVEEPAPSPPPAEEKPTPVKESPPKKTTRRRRRKPAQAKTKKATSES